MAVLAIRTFGDPALRQRAREVEKITPAHRRLIKDMIDTMRDAPGVGLAGPQVGVLERIFVYEVEDRVGAVFNPQIVANTDETITEDEGCLSVPGLLYPVERFRGVTIVGLDEGGKEVSIVADELLARVFQHEIDHLDGVLFIDRLPEELRKDAMRALTQQTLGLAPAPPEPPKEEVL